MNLDNFFERAKKGLEDYFLGNHTNQEACYREHITSRDSLYWKLQNTKRVKIYHNVTKQASNIASAVGLAKLLLKRNPSTALLYLVAGESIRIITSALTHIDKERELLRQQFQTMNNNFSRRY